MLIDEMKLSPWDCVRKAERVLETQIKKEKIASPWDTPEIKNDEIRFESRFRQ